MEDKELPLLCYCNELLHPLVSLDRLLQEKVINQPHVADVGRDQQYSLLWFAHRFQERKIITIGEPQQAILLIAAYVGDVRLIDNLFLQEPVQGN